MSLFFSLTDTSLYLPFNCDELLNDTRRVISIDTLAGRESRDLGDDLSDINIETMLTTNELSSLSIAYKNGTKIGLSFSLTAYEGFVQKIESKNSANGSNIVKIVFVTTGEI